MANLSYKVTSVDDLPENVRVFYSQDQNDNGDYILNVDGVVPKAKLNEFRNNNVQLTNKVNELIEQTKKFKDIDPLQARDALKIVEKLKDQKVYDDNGIEAVVEERTARMRTAHDTQVDALNKAQQEVQSKNMQLETYLKRVTLNNAAIEAANKAGVNPQAIPDIISRVSSVFKVEGLENNDINFVPYDQSGKQIYDQSGQKIMGLAEWIKDLQQLAPHLFMASQGGGSRGGGRGMGTRTVTPDDLSAGRVNLKELASGKFKLQR